MYLVCLDLEGVLVPEIWISVAEATGIPELRRTTRDEPDYDKLMRGRIAILAKTGLRLADIQKVIGGMDALPGAIEFLDELRRAAQVIILSDTFVEFASPLMEKLGRPTLLCNSLAVDGGGMIADYRLRIRDGKRKAVAALEGIGYDVIAAGDSYNDISMLETASVGILFRPPPAIREAYPRFPVAVDHRQLLERIRAAIGG